jgi:hypothetical protein
MMGSVTGAKRRSLIAKSSVKPRILDRFWILIEEDFVERWIVDMELPWRNANNRPWAVLGTHDLQMRHLTIYLMQFCYMAAELPPQHYIVIEFVPL